MATREPFITRVDGTLENLVIDGAILMQDPLPAPSTPRSLLIPLSTTRELSIRNLGGCADMLNGGGALNALFEAMKSMTDLKVLTIEDFTLPNPSTPPPSPRCLADSPIDVPHLIIKNVHGASLTFLLDCIATDHLTLDACSHVRELPDCDRLTLRNIPHFAGFLPVLVGWDGNELIVDSCSFFDEQFNFLLRQVMVESGEAIWPYACGTFSGLSFATWRQICEWEDLRLRM